MTPPTIQFYHLLTSPLSVALPRLVKKIRDNGLKLCITVAEETYAQLDNALWEQKGEVFLPHCLATDPRAALHPIVLSAQPSMVNNAEILCITNGIAYHPTMPIYSKILTMFDGENSNSLQHARALWKEYQAVGYGLMYFQQQEGGGWKNMRAVEAKPL